MNVDSSNTARATSILYKQALKFLDESTQLNAEVLQEANRIAGCPFSPLDMQRNIEQSAFMMPAGGQPGGLEALRDRMRSTLAEGIKTYDALADKLSAPGYYPTPPPMPYQPTATYGFVQPLQSFDVGVAILLHFVTLGIFSFFHFNLMHGNLPKLRPDDPSAGKAIGFMFIPFFNLYWVFFSYTRLCLRIDEQRVQRGLPPSNLQGLAIAMCVTMIIPYVNLFICWPILAPIFFGMLRSSANELVACSSGYQGPRY
jgi:hypothetical protein